MAVSPTSSKSNTGLDVASIVDGLMQIERRPLEKLTSKIELSQLKVSSVGTFTSSLSKVQEALLDLKASAASAVSTTNAQVATATASADLSTGSYVVSVTKVATPTVWNISGFTSIEQAQRWFAQKNSPSTTFAGITATYITTGANAVTLSLRSDATGTAADFSSKVVAGPYTKETQVTVTAGWDDPGTDSAVEAIDVVGVLYQDGTDAVVRVNGVEITSASNTINNAVIGLSITLNPQAVANSFATLTVTRDEAAGREKIDNFISAYNELVDTYRSLSKSDPDAKLRGPLSGDSSLAQAMRTVTQGIIGSMQTSGGEAVPGGLTALGIRFTRLNDGKLEFFPDKPDDDPTGNRWGYDPVAAADILAKGVRFDVTDGIDLLRRVDEILAPAGTLLSDGTPQLIDGLLRERVRSEEIMQRDLQKRRLDFEEKLISIQARYLSEYAALDALLFRLNNVSESLKSSLDALTNSQKNR